MNWKPGDGEWFEIPRGLEALVRPRGEVPCIPSPIRFSSNVCSMLQPGNSVLAHFKALEVPYWGLRLFKGTRSLKAGKEGVQEIDAAYTAWYIPFFLSPGPIKGATCYPAAVVVLTKTRIIKFAVTGQGPVIFVFSSLFPFFFPSHFLSSHCSRAPSQ